MATTLLESSDVLDDARGVSRTRRVAALLAFRNISAVYILAALVLVFAIRIPDVFLTETTWRTLVDSQSIVALTAIALVLPLAAGAFNLAVGMQVGVAGILVGSFLTSGDHSTTASIGLTLLAGMAIGLGTGLLIVKARIDSFIATLGVSFLLAALVTAITGGLQILNLPAEFASIGTNSIFGLTYPVVGVLIVSVLVWYVLECTPVGRRVYATGGNPEAARLAESTRPSS